MLKRLGFALALCGSSAAAQSLELVSAITMPDPFGTFGGLSAIELSQDGLTGLVLSDRGSIFNLTLERDDTGTLRKATPHPAPLPGYPRDTEGLAIGPTGRFVSFEGPGRVHRLWGKSLPVHADFNTFQPNAALEALAIDEGGTLYTLPERSGHPDRPFPLYALNNGEWMIVARIPRVGPFLAVGADFGPDGLFYLLERTFTPLGFRSRIRRFDLSDASQPAVTLMRSFPGQHGNLEGISLWSDPQGNTRVTMVADDNFLAALPNEIVEYVLRP